MKKFYENFVLRSTENGGENSGGGNPNPNAGEGENDETEQEYVDPYAEDDSAMYEDEEPIIDGGTIPGVVVVAPALPDDDEGDGDEGDDETIPEPDEEEDDGEGEGDIEEETPETEEKPGEVSSLSQEERQAIMMREFYQNNTNVKFGGVLTLEQKMAFVEAFYSLPKMLQKLSVTVKFNPAMQESGSCLRGGVITFRNPGCVKEAILEEYIHAYQEMLMGWSQMNASRAQCEFEAKMIEHLNYFAHHRLNEREWIDVNDGGRSLYECAKGESSNCFDAIVSHTSTSYMSGWGLHRKDSTIQLPTTALDATFRCSVFDRTAISIALFSCTESDNEQRSSRTKSGRFIMAMVVLLVFE